jgi:hypothetical protein
MATRAAWSLGLLVVALVLGVSSAGGRSLATGTLVVQVLGNGYVNASGGQIDCGQGSKRCYFSSTTSASITLTASVGFQSWIGSHDCNGTTQSCTFTLDPGDDVEEVANFAPTPTTTLTVNVTSDSEDTDSNVSGADIDCDAGDTDCSTGVYTGSTVTLLEDPADGHDFNGWGGACSGTDVACTVSLSSAQTVNAAFAKSATTRTLSVTVKGNGTVTGGGITCTSAGGSGCTASEGAGSSVTLTATAGSGAGFTGWGGACTGSTTTCTLTMSADQTVTASFTGAGGGAAPSTFPLTVSVSGQGRVTGGSLSCGAGGSVCSSNEPAGSSVTLTALPGDDAGFSRWGGACSGTNATCTLTMSSAKTVTATFSGSSTAQVPLTVAVTGRGAVTGDGIRCGNGAKACSVRESQGSRVDLTATPAAGASFEGWGGACTGATPACTVTMDAAKSVTAMFSGGSAPVAGAVLRSRGAPLVRRTRTGYAVTLRFRAPRRGPVRVRALRAGRLEAALSFTAPAGSASVGPFPLAKQGFYLFDLSQAGRTLHWRACLGRCGEAAARSAGPFTLTRQTPTVVDAGALWSVILRFRSTQPAGAELRVYRAKRLARDVRFASHVGRERAGPLLLSPGTYLLRLTAVDAYGRTRVLTWVAVLL